MALLQQLKPALDEIADKLLAEETVPGEEVLAAIARLPEHHHEARVSSIIGHAMSSIDRVAASAMENDGFIDLAPVEQPEDDGPGML